MVGTKVFRPCLLHPIDELKTATLLLDNAANAILSNDLVSARNFIVQANIPAVWHYARRVMGKYDDEIHRFDRLGLMSSPVAKIPRIKARMPSPTLTMDIYRRDGFRCRYCQMPVIIPAARTVMMTAAPDVLLWPAKDDQKHAAFYALTSVVDHLVPHARGGTNDPDNLVTSCQSCNYGKGNYLIEELELLDPREREPIVNDWDGLTRLLPLVKSQNGSPMPTPSSMPETAKAPDPSPKAKHEKPQGMKRSKQRDLDDFHPNHATELRRLLKRCEAAGLSWGLNKALILRMETGTSVLEIVGVSADGTVEIPWSLVDHRQEYRVFAERLAAAIDGTEVYQTEKGWWRIKKHGRKLTLEELIEASDGLILAIVDFRAAING